MNCGLTVTVGPDKFSEKSTDEKLELIYEAVTTQQIICIETVKSFKKKFNNYDKHIEKSHNPSKKNRKIDLGVGAGTGVVGGYSISEIIELIKNYVSGG